MDRQYLKVLLVVDSLDIGGAERHVVDLAVALNRAGHYVEVACSFGGLLQVELTEAGISVHILCDRVVKRYVSFDLAWKLRRLVRRQRYSVVHAHLYASTTASALALIGTGVPLLVTEHSEAAWRGPGSHIAHRWALRRATGVVAVSGALGTRLIMRDGVPHNRVSVITNARLPTARWPPPSFLPDRSGPTIGVVARLCPEKGVGVFLKAAAAILAGIPECRFVIIGDGPLHGLLLRESHQLGLASHVLFLGARPDAAQSMRCFDILVVPSLSEGTPLVVLEARQHAIPVVASKVGGIPEQIDHGTDGLLVAPGDAGELATACILLIRDPAYRCRLGHAGHERILAGDGHSTMVQRIERLYQQSAQAGIARSAVPADSPCTLSCTQQ